MCFKKFSKKNHLTSLLYFIVKLTALLTNKPKLQRHKTQRPNSVSLVVPFRNESKSELKPAPYQWNVSTRHNRTQQSHTSNPRIHLEARRQPSSTAAHRHAVPGVWAEVQRPRGHARRPAPRPALAPPQRRRLRRHEPQPQVQHGLLRHQPAESRQRWVIWRFVIKNLLKQLHY